MASPRIAWGIDIGNRALKAVKLVRNGDDIRVDDFDVVEHDTILSLSGDNRDDLIKKALATFAARKNVKGAVVAVSVSGGQSFARFIKLPPVEPKKIPEIVKFEAIQQIPFPLDDVEWDYQLFSPPDSPDVEVGIFAIRKDLVSAHVRTFTDYMLNVQVVQMGPLALYNAMQRDTRLDQGIAMIVDVGAETTDLIIAGNETIWHRSIPIGGNNFTDALTKAFKVPHAKAEELKRDAQGSKYARQIFQAMRPVFADLVAEIQRSVGFYGTVNKDARIVKIITLGGTFQLPALGKYLEQNLQLPVERPEAFAAGAPSDAKTAAGMNENLLSLHTAYGLALQAMGEAKVTSSLLPAAIRREKAWREKNKWFAATAALFLLAPVIGVGRYLVDRVAFDGNQGAFEDARRVLQAAQGLDGRWSTVASAGASELQTIQNVNELLLGRDLWPRLISELLAAVPTPGSELEQAIVAGNRAAVVAIPRAQRRIFNIETLQSLYEPNLAVRTTPPAKLTDFITDFGRAGAGSLGTVGGFRPAMGGGMPGEFGGFGGEFGGPPRGGFGGFGEAPTEGAGVPEGPRGFFMRMVVVTPMSDPGAAIAEIEKRLKAIAPNAEQTVRPFAVTQVELVGFRTVASDTTGVRARLAAEQAARLAAEAGFEGGQNTGGFGGGGFGGGFGGGMGGRGEFGPGFGEFGPAGGGFSPPGAQANVNPDQVTLTDPLTGEDVGQDQILEFVLAIQLDPPAFASPEAEQTESTDGPAAE
jgi:type IV pilus assembly protein PilM